MTGPETGDRKCSSGKHPAFKNRMSTSMPTWNQWFSFAQKEVDKTLRALPKPLAAEASQLPVTFESVPTPELQAEGIDPDTLGLFTGPSYGEEFSSLASVPPQIFLFLENLWAVADGDWEEFRQEMGFNVSEEEVEEIQEDEGDENGDAEPPGEEWDCRCGALNGPDRTVCRKCAGHYEATRED
jgi:hypothetical protein